MATRYWVASLPVGQGSSASTVWSRLQESISKQAFDTSLYRANSFIEGVSHKIRRQIEELERVSGVVSSSLTVDGVPVDSYLTRQLAAHSCVFFSVLNFALCVHMDLIAKIEDDLKLENVILSDYTHIVLNIDEDASGKQCNLSPVFFDAKVTSTADYRRPSLCLDFLSQVRVSEYSNVRSQLNAINRKQGGSLAVRDLSNLVKPQDIISSEHLTTLLAVVPKYSQKDWLSSYETLTTYVVPRSSKKLHEDNEYALYTVTLFSRDADNFRTKARKKLSGKLCVIPLVLPDVSSSLCETQESRKQELEKMMQDQETLRSSLLQWCYTSYGEVFSSWMHFCAVRVFSESILRYGLPPSFLSVVLSPPTKSEKKVRSILEGLCSNSNSTYWKTEDEGGMGGFAGDADTHPYVSFTINLI
ncbi:hypothetical protein DH2020_018930 [Rehmannia glutinosa]|uniref:V-type proton ATPase subunit C n=1 Tax=Rehmannia glutinosa TaxID=99300 RepID=A0ABR0WKB4_REHGL